MAAEDRFPEFTREHRAIWEGFVTFLKIGTAATIAIVVMLSLFVA